MRYKIAPSLLAADFARLGDQVSAVDGVADMLHLDVMDGHFVPNISFGIPVIAALRDLTDLTFDCHIMTSNPTTYLAELAEAGVDLVTMHVEAVADPTRAASAARALGLSFGVVVSPPTPWAAVEPFVELCDLVLVMSVHPGFGGQAFMPEVLHKVEAARKWVDSHGLTTDIQIDGGISDKTAPSARDAGANVFVAGTAVFGADDPALAVAELRAVIEGVTGV
ncbi:MAG: ribulose-phosphate 3-epimerase [Acidimicrobiia bacterium]|nr:ribulose-phosphate 3-epimerase [Acidimicrobiia bacterium]MDH4306835.1 ribulose-phosphate 3-epimerase [Acidimicrobiia bacterium]MDH5295266.1 ribulose-phosphate 3-epimerase [Acidimicrobiia bacterium]